MFKVNYEEVINAALSCLSSSVGFVACNFSSITSHLMSDDVMGRVASYFGIKDLVQTAVCVFR